MAAPAGPVYPLSAKVMPERAELERSANDYRSRIGGITAGIGQMPPPNEQCASDRIIEGLRESEHRLELVGGRIRTFCDRLLGPRPASGQSPTSDTPTPVYPFVQEVELRVNDLNGRLARCLDELDRLEAFL